jgi:hypothetical protein
MMICKMKKCSDGTPMVEQHKIGGCVVTWNPDTERFHVSHKGKKDAVFIEYRNAIGYAKRVG